MDPNALHEQLEAARRYGRMINHCCETGRCGCPCHQPDGPQHGFVQCCKPCPDCGDKIALDKWALHATVCEAKQEDI